MLLSPFCSSTGPLLAIACEVNPRQENSLDNLDLTATPRSKASKRPSDADLAGS